MQDIVMKLPPPDSGIIFFHVDLGLHHSKIFVDSVCDHMLLVLELEASDSYRLRSNSC